jgi:hypothetical protein
VDRLGGDRPLGGAGEGLGESHRRWFAQLQIVRQSAGEAGERREPEARGARLESP